MADNAHSYEHAENLRKNKQYPEAAAQFAMLWEQRPNQYFGWRYAFCLRKVGQLDQAEQVARAALEKYPEDKFTLRELGWVLYDKELKAAKGESDLGRAIHFANEIVALNPDAFAMRLVALAVMKVGKGRKKWNGMLEWADKLKPEELSNEPFAFEGKRVMSKREAWYVGKSRALLELERYDEAREQAQAGLDEFPDDVFLKRTAALALARLGKEEEAAQELRVLLMHPRADWYVKADLAEVEHALGRKEEAFRLLCEAVSNPQANKYKWEYFMTLAKIALALGKLNVAAEHVALAKAVRAAEGWSPPAALVQVEQDTHKALRDQGQSWPQLPESSDELTQICRGRWLEGAMAGLELTRGTLGVINSNRPFAFIKRDDGGENVFVLIRDIPKKCAHEGARLEFTLKNSFDRKKNRESVQAANIRCLKD